MKALTLWQPWAACVAYAGKTVENREWAAPRSVIGTRIAIHAAKRIAADYEGFCVRGFASAARDLLVAKYGPEVLVSPSSVLPRSVIVCTAVVARCVRIGDGDPIERSEWFAGPYGWVLEDVRTLCKPVLCIGAQGLWPVASGVEAAVRAADGGAK